MNSPKTYPLPVAFQAGGEPIKDIIDKLYVFSRYFSPDTILSLDDLSNPEVIRSLYLQQITGLLISGDPTEDEVLTLTDATFEVEPDSVVYAWFRVDDEGAVTTIADADEATYTLTSDDVDSTVYGQATYTNKYGPFTVQSGQVGPVEAAEA